MIETVKEETMMVPRINIEVDVRVLKDVENDTYLFQVYDEKYGEYFPDENIADNDCWMPSEQEAIDEGFSQLDNDYVMGCGIFFEEDEILCPDCNVALIFNDDFECPNCGKCWDKEDLNTEL